MDQKPTHPPVSGVACDARPRRTPTRVASDAADGIDADLALSEVLRRDLDPHVGRARAAFLAVARAESGAARRRLWLGSSAGALAAACVVAGVASHLTTAPPPTAPPELPVVARSETWRNEPAGTVVVAGVEMAALRRQRTQVLAFRDGDLDVRISVPERDWLLVATGD